MNSPEEFFNNRLSELCSEKGFMCTRSETQNLGTDIQYSPLRCEADLKPTKDGQAASRTCLRAIEVLIKAFEFQVRQISVTQRLKECTVFGFVRDVQSTGIFDIQSITLAMAYGSASLYFNFSLLEIGYTITDLKLWQEDFCGTLIGRRFDNE